MAKFFGRVGYAVSRETAPGVWTDKIQTMPYRGDVLSVRSKWEDGESKQDNLRINNEFSLVADPFAYQNFARIKFIEWMGVRWKVTSVKVERPRLIISIGGEYNGDQK